MKVTMLYFHTVSELIKKFGYTWNDVSGIKDHKGRVKHGENGRFESSLEYMFYSTHMGGFNENSDNAKALISAFLVALEEARNSRLALANG